MKQRDQVSGGGGQGPRSRDTVAPLLDALLSLRTPDEMRRFLLDLCTPAELEAIADRWGVVPLLLEDTPYREIHDKTAVSVTTIGRVARSLSFGSGGYRTAAERVFTIPGKTKKARR